MWCHYLSPYKRETVEAWLFYSPSLLTCKIPASARDLQVAGKCTCAIFSSAVLHSTARVPPSTSLFHFHCCHLSFNLQVLEQLSLPGQRLQPQQNFRWWTQPCKSQAAESAWSLSLRPRQMVFFPAGGVLFFKSCVTRWRSYGRKRAGCAASERMRGRQDLLRDAAPSRAPAPNCTGDTGRVCSWWSGKCKLWGRRRMEARDFWHRGSGSSST